MALIRDRALSEDSWRYIEDGEPVPSEGGAIVSLERWWTEREQLSGRNAPIGVRLHSDTAAESLVADIDRLDLVAVPFNQFKDGRGYSTARLLRERYGFTGELRAVGNILRDQLAFLERCGFDSFEYAGGTDAAEALTAFDEIDIVYQTATDRRQSAAATRNHPSRAFSNGTSG
ncbi:MAG: DUF934 domain-containing protein [Rhodospirillaceae bacterium]|jgi:uncharacterized protein (DUF934 family)|nr:DUF934 domain-containing protein [Rhodospirillaceae bacterium]MBT5945346.1 DUF934 domain-containing protein [Rhodospirillaceae bacterium]MBT6403666.1 DUF934 domain-containing protein [Rhodospirillaceae bacterium]MBT6537363.1 DUF934 domain-containing protein [Rhodospirillaceae bacterium]MBT7362481.1 DUF934 domain-containing protein [Rhodospirillaceae bacterium]